MYEGSLIKSGAGSLVLSGDSTYRGPTLVNGGLLAVNGALTSAVTVNDSGTLGGSGRIGALSVNSGGRVAPGNSVGTLQVAGDVNLGAGSTYAVELTPTRSDRIVAGGKAVLGGGTVTLALENSPTLLSQSQAQSLIGRQYSIIEAAGGIQGQFGQVLPNYLFLGGTLDYAANGVQLAVGRNDASFASVAATRNQRAVATAAEQLGAGNPVYESLLQSDSIATARQGLQQLSGEIYPAVGAMLINDSRQLRDAVGERLRHVPVAGERNLWFKALGAWGKSDTRGETAGSTTSLGGLLAGVDGALDEQTRVGVVAGYSDSSLNMGGGTHSSASIDSYHFGAYAGRELGDWRLSVGGAYSWHRGDVKRDLQYGEVSGKQKTKLEARTAQLFTEAAYRIHLQPLALEPFANLAYVHLDSDAFHEKGAAAALERGDDRRDAVLGTLGVRALKTLALNDHQQLELSGSLGWQHSLTAVESEEHLAFVAGGPSFAVRSAPLLRDAALVGLQASLALSPSTRVNLDYNGQLGGREKTQGVGLSLNWQF
ncbi:Extracellular serine protease precursor [Pseudomonas sp. 24 E 13]|nr:Extracellular serine protease precursor [Pseudomonas sp. 24 E 13]